MSLLSPTPGAGLWSNAPHRYSRALVALHWISVLLIVAAYATMELRGLAPKGAGRDAMKTAHYLIGLTLWGLVAIRLLGRGIAGPAPVITPPLPLWQARASAALHIALYLLLIALPLLGWLSLSASGTPVAAFGVALPALIAENKGLGRDLKEVHETIATIGYGLIGLHALAALAHHYLIGDDTLRRMRFGG